MKEYFCKETTFCVQQWQVWEVFVAQLQWLSGKFHEVRGVMHQFLCQQSIAVCNHAADLVIIPNNWLQPWCSNTSSGWSVRDLYLCCHFKGFDELMKAWESCLKHMVPQKLYIPSILNIDFILWHTKLIAYAVKWFKSWVISFTFQAYTLPHTLNCIWFSLFEFHTWILKQF